MRPAELVAGAKLRDISGMAKAHDTWKVLPHRPIEVVADNLWRVEGKLETMPLKRVMTIARREDGQLVVHNAMALDPESMARIDASCSIGWWVGPSSPTPTESWVNTNTTLARLSAARRTAGRM